MNSAILQEYQGEAPAPLIERFLRDREGVWRQIATGSQLDSLIRGMLVNSTAAFACYGAVMGLSHSPLQALVSAIKLPLLFILTLAICLPTLYLFNLLFGGRLSARQSLALVLAAITVTAALSLGFAPITLFFLITARSYPLFILLNVAVLALAGGVGLSFLVSGMRSLNTAGQPAAEGQPPAPRPLNAGLLYSWVLLYGFVGAQLGWTLRPVLGNPDLPFQLFHTIEGSFFGGVFEAFLSLMR